ncbi:MAG: glycosyl transferase group 2 family [Planctomycetota bacterium]|nr:MAG: glycosyl transferase group 2 family [Planctomycetota bacterium]
MISVLVLTLNEEANMQRCLDSVKWSDDVVVFDSLSTDRTCEIARAAGARVVQRAFDNYGSQREAARTTVQFRNRWVLALDADERPDEVLISEMKEIATRPDVPEGAFRMRRKDHFFGRWLRFSTLYPTWFVRFFQPDRIRYEPRTVHEHPIIEGPTGVLKGHLLHDNMSKGLDEWQAKHERYARFEAVENLKALHLGIDWRGIILVTNPVRQRRALKELSFRMPFRPLLRFLYMYVWRLGFLDGCAGLRYCRLISHYERLIVRNMGELRRGATAP